MTTTCYSAEAARDHALDAESCEVCGATLPEGRDAAAPPDEAGTWAVFGQLRAERSRSGRAHHWHWGVGVLCGDCGRAVVDALDARRATAPAPATPPEAAR